jgi:hypothetical protein
MRLIRVFTRLPKKKDLGGVSLQRQGAALENWIDSVSISGFPAPQPDSLRYFAGTRRGPMDDDPDSDLYCEPMMPKLEVPCTRPGYPNCTRLNKLNASTRNCT